MATYNYQDLIVWQKAMLLVEGAYKVTAQLPKSEVYALADQIRRSSMSIPSNIAEGQKRLSKNETTHFIGIALGSVAELETQLILCQRLYSIDVSEELGLCAEVGKMATALVRKLRSEI